MMKKLFALSVVVAIVITMAVPSFAGSLGTYYGEVPYCPEEIVIDSVQDEAYIKYNALKVLIDYIPSDEFNTGIHGTAYLLWSDGYLYTWIQVDDPEVCSPDPAKQVSSPWQTDCVEFFIDHTNESYMERDDGVSDGYVGKDYSNVIQYRLDVSGWPSVYGHDEEGNTWSAYGQNGQGRPDADGNYADAYFDYAGNFVSNLYFVEYKIPLNEGVSAGDELGFGFMITDYYNGAADCTYAKLSDSEGYIWWVQNLNYVSLGEKAEDAVVELTDPEIPAVTEPEVPVVPDTPATNNPVTADLSVLFYALASVSAVGGLSLIGKKK